MLCWILQAFGITAFLKIVVLNHLRCNRVSSMQSLHKSRITLQFIRYKCCRPMSLLFLNRSLPHSPAAIKIADYSTSYIPTRPTSLFSLDCAQIHKSVNVCCVPLFFKPSLHRNDVAQLKLNLTAVVNSRQWRN
jgi:hypothetical protein